MSSDFRFSTLLSFIAAMVFAAIAFHTLQNNGTLPGGTVPAAKTAWLFTVLFYWYLLPLLWCANASLPTQVRIAFGIALLNMVLRAVFELPMMYVTNNWLHAYGIGHDVFSIALSLVLLLWLVYKVKENTATWARIYFAYSAVLFTVEAFFAAYLRKVTGADGSVFFLSSQSSHAFVLTITVVFVLLSWLVIAMLVHRLRLRHDHE